MAGSIQGIRTWPQGANFDDRAAITGPPVNARSAALAVRAAADAKPRPDGSADNPDPCVRFEAPNHDYDRCVRASVQNTALFQKQDASDADAVDSQDVLQGSIGDCYIMAPLAALASTSRGRAFIRNEIVENKNDNGDVASWTVTLHRPESHLFGETTFCEVHVTVGGPFVEGHAQVRPGSSQNEVWPIVMEKAFAQYAGGYNNIGRGGAPVDAMAVLTGREASYVSFDWPNRWFRSYGANEIQTDLANGKMLILSTRADIDQEAQREASLAAPQTNAGAHGLVAGHAYFVKGVEQHDGKLYVKLGNPWGNADTDLIACDELTTWFSGISLGSVP